MSEQNSLVLSLDSGGDVVIRLRPDLAPQHVAQISALASEGFYDGVTFHRVIDGFMAQGGDPSGTGAGGSDKPNLPAEFSREPHVRGVCSMARTSDPNSANSQFFICLDDAKSAALDRKYTAFGEVVTGMEAVQKIAAAPIADELLGRPKERQVIEKVEVKPVTAGENPYVAILRPSGDDERQLAQPGIRDNRK